MLTIAGKLTQWYRRARLGIVATMDSKHIAKAAALLMLRAGSAFLVSAAVTGCWNSATPLAPQIGGAIGVPHAGSLTEGTKLAGRGEGYVRYRSDTIQWGHPRLVHGIETAAAAVAKTRPGGASLVVADLAGKRGGQIPRHRSHRSGRDADLLFYVLTPAGRSIQNPGFLHFGRDGFAETKSKNHKRLPPYVRIDVPRSWLLVKSLDAAGIEWIFVARWLEAMLVEHALALGEPEALLARLTQTLHQPSDSLSHDDHFHVRVACSAEDMVAGCRGANFRWPWLEPVPQPLALSDKQLLAVLFDDG